MFPAWHNDPGLPEGNLVEDPDGVLLARIQSASFDTTSVRMKLAAMRSGRLPDDEADHALAAIFVRRREGRARAGSTDSRPRC